MRVQPGKKKDRSRSKSRKGQPCFSWGTGNGGGKNYGQPGKRVKRERHPPGGLNPRRAPGEVKDTRRKKRSSVSRGELVFRSKDPQRGKLYHKLQSMTTSKGSERHYERFGSQEVRCPEDNEIRSKSLIGVTNRAYQNLTRRKKSPCWKTQVTALKMRGRRGPT